MRAAETRGTFSGGFRVFRSLGGGGGGGILRKYSDVVNAHHHFGTCPFRV